MARRDSSASRSSDAPPAELVGAVEAALDSIGCKRVKWKTFSLTLEHAGKKRVFDAHPLFTSLAALGEVPSAATMRLRVGLQLGLIHAEEAGASPRAVRSMLRPRLVNRSILDGPHRALCRRDAFGELIRTVSFGVGPDARFVTTAVLDQWDMEFDEVFQIALENLLSALGPDPVSEVADTGGLIAVLHDDEPASAACYLLDRFIGPAPSDGRRARRGRRDSAEEDADEPAPDQRWLGPHGVVFSVPADQSLVALPVVAGAGADGLAALVQVTYSMIAERASPLTDEIYWWLHDGVRVLPMTWIEEAGARRVHMEAVGPIEDLLRVLGAIE